MPGLCNEQCAGISAVVNWLRHKSCNRFNQRAQRITTKKNGRKVVPLLSAFILVHKNQVVVFYAFGITS